MKAEVFTHNCALALAALLLSFSGCFQRTSSLGFRLPDGDAEKGKAAFVSLNCHSCHTVAKTTLPKPESPGHISLEIGGEVLRVRTYGELVTAIINPSHIVSEKHRKLFSKEQGLSAMPQFNQVMTVEQMIDLVAFLQIHYEFPPGMPVIAAQ